MMNLNFIESKKSADVAPRRFEVTLKVLPVSMSLSKTLRKCENLTRTLNLPLCSFERTHDAFRV